VICCPKCDGPPIVLGSLGAVCHYRCRDCGWVYQAPPPEEQTNEEADWYEELERGYAQDRI
jgi:tRNA(Ile2) C34 agmatinyltransferase TiaS